MLLLVSFVYVCLNSIAVNDKVCFTSLSPQLMLTSPLPDKKMVIRPSPFVVKIIVFNCGGGGGGGGCEGISPVYIASTVQAAKNIVTIDNENNSLDKGINLLAAAIIFKNLLFMLYSFVLKSIINFKN